MKQLTQAAPTGATPPNKLAGTRGSAPSKWTLLQGIEDIRQPLGLNGTSISLLRAMISFIKGDHLIAHRDEGHICFASNAALSKRAHVSVQTVERHISKLVALGLLTRRSSANGKRWARRDTSGQIRLATGLSLMPLADRHAEFIALNQTRQEELNKIAILRDKCSIALAQLKAQLPDRAELETLFNSARNILRRRVDASALTRLLSEISAECEAPQFSQPLRSRTADPENEGHKETQLNQSVKETNSLEDKVSPTQMERAYPRLCAELRTAQTQRECEHRMAQIASHLHLGALWHEITKLGPAKTFMTLGYLLERADTLKKPQGYAFHMLQGLEHGTIAWDSLLRPKTTKSRVALHHGCTEFALPRTA